MLKSHSFSPHHKVVPGKHNFSMPGNDQKTAGMGAPPEQLAGGPSAPHMGEQDQNFCDGGMEYGKK